MDSELYEVNCRGRFVLKPEYYDELRRFYFIAPKFIDKETLQETGWWRNLFNENTAYVVSYCEKCRCQRIHHVLNREFELDNQGKWRITGFSFICDFCKEEAE